jgi:hypothetical protein
LKPHSINSIVVFLVLFSLLLSAELEGHTSIALGASFPAYARIGASAFYSGNGGFIPFLSGVSGNISYFVTNVYSNGSMVIFLNGNLSLGSEVTVNVSSVSLNLTDSVFSPRVLPAISPSELGSTTILFENITCSFVTNADHAVPAGTFNATEYRGRNSNGTVLDFWFDRGSGLAIEMVEPSSYFQLINSNIAIPLSTETPLAAELPFILVFVLGWAGAGLLFYWVRRYYVKKSERAAIAKSGNASKEKAAR